MRHVFAATLCVAIVAVVPARAADIPRPVYKAAPVVAPAYSWAGWYGGFSGGYGWGDPFIIVDPSTVALPPSGQALATFSAADPFSFHTHPKGGFGGILLGYNAQFQAFIIGWEADFSLSGIRDTANGAFTNFAVFDTDTGSTNGLVSLETKLNWFGTVRGRAGVVFGTLMPFVTGGLAYGELKNTVTSSATQILNGVSAGGYNVSQTFTDRQLGYAVGGGLDWLIANNWLFRVEYLYFDFNGKDYVPAMPAVTLLNTDFTMQIVRGALVIKFAP
jgi:outer membrane immunogenic protein